MGNVNEVTLVANRVTEAAVMSELASPRSPGSGDFAQEDYDYDDDNDADFEDSRDYEDRESDEGEE